jgi:hypothetical protein
VAKLLTSRPAPVPCRLLGDGGTGPSAVLAVAGEHPLCSRPMLTYSATGVMVQHGRLLSTHIQLVMRIKCSGLLAGACRVYLADHLGAPAPKPATGWHCPPVLLVSMPPA